MFAAILAAGATAGGDDIFADDDTLGMEDRQSTEEVHADSCALQVQQVEVQQVAVQLVETLDATAEATTASEEQPEEQWMTIIGEMKQKISELDKLVVSIRDLDMESRSQAVQALKSQRDVLRMGVEFEKKLIVAGSKCSLKKGKCGCC